MHDVVWEVQLSGVVVQRAIIWARLLHRCTSGSDTANDYDDDDTDALLNPIKDVD